MEYTTDNKVILHNKLSVNLSTASWGTVTDITPPKPGYYVCQALSDNSAPIRIEDTLYREAFPRTHSVSFMPHGSTVRMHPSGQPLRLLSCVFDRTFFEDITGIGQRHWREYSGAFAMIDNKRLESILQHIHTEITHPGFGSELSIEGAGYMIAIEMARYGRRHPNTRIPLGQRPKGGLAPWQLRRIRERVDASVEQGYPTLSALATLCGISQSHLMHMFKASTGLSVHKYIATERLKAARKMLAENRLTATEISEKLGFCSPAYFSTAFRRMTGQTPTHFQRQARTLRNPT